MTDRTGHHSPASRPDAGRTVLVTSVCAATGSRAAAAALVCVGSEPDRAGLLIDLGEGRAPRPSLIATAAARELEERLAAHLPKAGLASRGRFCHLSLPSDVGGIERIAAALPAVRDSIAVIHLPPRLLQPALDEPRIRPSAALLRADLGEDRALTALAARELMERGTRVAVLKRPISWFAARAALLGAGSLNGLPDRLVERLLGDAKAPSHRCYAAEDEAAEPARTAQQERRDNERARPGRGIHRYSQRGAGR